MGRPCARLCSWASTYKGRVYVHFADFAGWGASLYLPLEISSSLMSPVDRGRAGQHVSLKSVPKTFASEEEFMLRRSNVWNSYDFSPLFLFSLCERQFVVHFV